MFISVNGGSSWTRVTDPNSPAISGRPHIPRARYAYFEHDEPGRIRLYLGTQGRGQWRIGFAKTVEPPVARRFLYTTLRVINNGNPRGCGYSDWNCMTNLCKADLSSVGWRGWSGCQSSGGAWLCLFECGQVRPLF